jgi:hypothetical protein
MKPTLKRVFATLAIVATLSFTTAHSPRTDGAIALAGATGGMTVVIGISIAAGAALTVVGTTGLVISLTSQPQNRLGTLSSLVGLVTGLLVLPADGAPEFAAAEPGFKDLLEEERLLYNDLVPALNAQSRRLLAEVEDFPSHWTGEERNLAAKELWNQAFDQMGLTEQERDVLAIILSTDEDEDSDA